MNTVGLSSRRFPSSRVVLFNGICFIFGLLIAGFLPLSSQPLEPRHAGKEFLFVLPQNDRGLYDPSTGPREVGMYIAPEGGLGSSGFVEYDDEQGRVREAFSVEAGEMIRFLLPPAAELAYEERNQGKTITVVVEEGDPVVVYALSSVPFTSDATIIPPISSLGTTYIASAYRNNLQHRKYSFIGIAATEDDTEITIVSPNPIRNPFGGADTRPYDSISLILNKGESRLILGAETRTSDLTGARLTSDKPFFACSGHERTMTNRVLRSGLPLAGVNTDYLLTSLPPVEQLGVTAIVGTFAFNGTIVPNKSRVIAAFDSTTITFSGGTRLLVREGDVFEFDITTAELFSTDKPALFAQIGYSQNTVGNRGDPLLLTLPPVEQYLQSYTFITPALSNFDEHYVNISIPTAAISSLLLDGQQPEITLQQDIEGTEYSLVTVQVLPGRHFIAAEAPFGIVCYGLRQFDSYGYAGGTGARRLVERLMDKEPPTLTETTVECEAQLHWVENHPFASGIESIFLQNSQNIHLLETSIEPQRASSRLALQDPYSDGFALLAITDSAGNTRLDEVAIPGFTLTADDARWEVLSLRASDCDSVLLRNTGTFPLTFSLAMAHNITLALPPSLRTLTLAPGEEHRIPVCYLLTAGEAGDDTLVLVDDCQRDIFLPLAKTFQGSTTFVGESRCNAPIQAGSTKRMRRRGHSIEVDIPAVVIFYDSIGREYLRLEGTTPHWSAPLPGSMRGGLLYRIIAEGQLIETGTIFVEP